VHSTRLRACSAFVKLSLHGVGITGPHKTDSTGDCTGAAN
jgi:hypothetical protein